MAIDDNGFGSMSGISAKPDLVVYLQSNVPRLLNNIKKRGRDYEKQISPDYLQELSDAYNQLFYHYNRTPLIIIDTVEADIKNNHEQLSYMKVQISNQPKSSKSHT